MVRDLCQESFCACPIDLIFGKALLHCDLDGPHQPHQPLLVIPLTLVPSNKRAKQTFKTLELIKQYWICSLQTEHGACQGPAFLTEYHSELLLTGQVSYVLCVSVRRIAEQPEQYCFPIPLMVIDICLPRRHGQRMKEHFQTAVYILGL